jgi:hypothetical protein
MTGATVSANAIIHILNVKKGKEERTASWLLFGETNYLL